MDLHTVFLTNMLVLQHPSTTNLTIVWHIPSGFVWKWVTPKFDVISSVSQSKFIFWCISYFWTHPNNHRYIMIHYTNISHDIPNISDDALSCGGLKKKKNMFATERYLSAAVKSHSVSMAVRTSKDVAGGYWTAAGTRHCLIKQLALMRYNYPYLPTCITNIHKQHLYDGSEIRGLPGCANDSHQGLVGYQVISDLKIEALEKRQPTWIYHDVFTLIDRYSHCLPLWVNIPMLPGSQVAIPTQRQDHSFNRVQSRNSRGKKTYLNKLNIKIDLQKWINSTGLSKQTWSSTLHSQFSSPSNLPKKTEDQTHHLSGQKIADPAEPGYLTSIDFWL